jgi:hypothetical protein
MKTKSDLCQTDSKGAAIAAVLQESNYLPAEK